MKASWSTKKKKNKVKMKRKSRKKIKATYKESPLPKKEKKRLLWKVFDLLLSQKNDASEK